MAKRWSFIDKLLRRSRVEHEIDDEMRFHVEQHIEHLIRQGVPPEEAARRARMEFGSVDSAKEESRKTIGVAWIDRLRRDARYGTRVLWKNPGWTASAILTLALCIGANTAIFSVVDAVLLRPLPYPSPEELLQVGRFETNKSGQFPGFNHDGKTWFALKANAGTIDAAVYTDTTSSANFVAGETAAALQQQRVSAGFFHVLGLPMALGRDFTEEEDRAGGPAAAILSYALWQRSFHGDPSIIGKTIHLRGEPFTVVGVNAADFRTMVRADIWTPIRPSTQGEGEGLNYCIIARLRPGATVAQADAQVQSIGRGLLADVRLSPDVQVEYHVVSLQRGLTDSVRQTLTILWLAVALVLLIGCLNIASLLVARHARRSREIATRIALGGGRTAVVHQLLVESLLIGIAGVVAGTAFGYTAISVFERTVPESLNIWQHVTLDSRVLAATIATSLAASILFGLFPALQATRRDIRSGLADLGTRNVAGSRKNRTRQVIVLTEIAISVVLVIGATLLIRTFNHLAGLKPGFDASNVVALKFSLQDERYRSAASIRTLLDKGLQRIEEVPGVESASAGLCLPYERPLNSGVRIGGGQSRFTNVCYATPGYFKTLRIPLLAGRDFAAADQPDSEPVAIVNETFVRKYLAGAKGDVVGTQIGMSKPTTIVGVAGTIPFRAGFNGYEPVDATPTVYIPVAQPTERFFRSAHTWFAPAWIVRTSGPQQRVVRDLQRALAAVDPLLPIAGVFTTDDLMLKSLAPQRFNAELMGLMAGLALLLALVGVYGLVANSVVERTREIGIRIALGAAPGSAIRMVASEGVFLAVIGSAAGCGIAIFATRLLRDLIYGLKVTDPITFAAVASGLVLVASAASVIPALRIVRIDPVETLRMD
jgi:predicted permease